MEPTTRRTFGNCRIGVKVQNTLLVATPATYSVDEVATLLGLARGNAYRCVRDGLIPAKRIGRRWMVPRKAFHEWLDACHTSEAAHGLH